MGLTPLISAEWNWRVQLLIPAILSLIATALAWRYFPESPRWLESRGRYQEAEKVMRSIEEGVIRQTGKPCRLWLLLMTVKHHKRCRIQPY